MDPDSSCGEDEPGDGDGAGASDLDETQDALLDEASDIDDALQEWGRSSLTVSSDGADAESMGPDNEQADCGDDPEAGSAHRGSALHGNNGSCKDRETMEDHRPSLALQQQQSLSRSTRVSSGPSIQISYADFAQMKDKMNKAVKTLQDIMEAAEQVLRTQGVSGHDDPKGLRASNLNDISGKLLVPQSLFGFPVDLASLDHDDSDASEDHDDQWRDSAARPGSRKKNGSQKWTAEDRSQLKKMKEKGWTDGRADWPRPR